MKVNFDKWINEKNTFKIILLGLILISLIIILFSWQRSYWITGSTIDSEIFGTLGDFIGGVVGSIWSLAGILLFYIALKDQKEDIALNRQALEKQIDSLDVQTKEFQHQTKESERTREIFDIQTDTFKKQQFEATFFSMLDVYTKINSNMPKNGNKDFFVNFWEEMNTDFDHSSNHSNDFNKSIEKYYSMFYQHKDDISHYYRTIYSILKFIDLSDLKDSDKEIYAKFLRSQFTEKELFILYYNAHTVYGEKFYPYILKYKLLKHLPSISKLEFLQFRQPNNNLSVNLLNFCNSINKFAFDFEPKYNDFLDENLDSEEQSEERFSTSFKDPFTSITIQFSCLDLREIEIEMSGITSKKLSGHFGYKIDLFRRFFECWLYDKFIYSNYVPTNEVKIKMTSSKANVTYLIESQSNLILS